VQLLIKTAANYIAFKTVKTTVDYTVNRGDSVDQYRKAVECAVCMNVWSNSPAFCPHCNCTVLKKLYRDYEYKRDESNSPFDIDSNLTMRSRHDTSR
jgi:hypothetical protein